MQINTSYESIYYNSRKGKEPKVIVIHGTGGSKAGDLQTLSKGGPNKVSVHYYIDRSGEIYQLLDESLSAYHAGVSKWKGLEVFEWNRWSLNPVSIGIELENDGAENYTDVQIDSLITLIRDIRTRWSIDKENIVGHNQIAPNRKIDPYEYFPWQKVRAGVFKKEEPKISEWAVDSWAKCLRKLKKNGETIKGPLDKIDKQTLVVLLDKLGLLD